MSDIDEPRTLDVLDIENSGGDGDLLGLFGGIIPLLLERKEIGWSRVEYRYTASEL
jgi:hypothetical protein